MTTPTLPPPDASSLAAWIEAGASAAAAVVAVLVFLGGILGAVWRFMVSPLRSKINSAHVRINETNARIDKVEVKVAEVSKTHTDEHIANLGRLSDINLKLATLPTKEDFDEMRREQREDARQQMARIDALFGKHGQ